MIIEDVDEIATPMYYPYLTLIFGQQFTSHPLRPVLRKDKQLSIKERQTPRNKLQSPHHLQQRKKNMPNPNNSVSKDGIQGNYPKNNRKYKRNSKKKINRSR